ncbi:MAG: hypothetical protein ABI885_30215 [Gammaproteobacteria bacterium]
MVSLYLGVISAETLRRIRRQSRLFDRDCLDATDLIEASWQAILKEAEERFNRTEPRAWRKTNRRTVDTES